MFTLHFATCTIIFIIVVANHDFKNSFELVLIILAFLEMIKIISSKAFVVVGNDQNRKFESICTVSESGRVVQ